MIVSVLAKKAPEALVIPLAQQEQLPEYLTAIARLAGCSAAALQTDFRADSKEVFVLYPSDGPAGRIYLVGLGKKSGFSDVYLALRAFCFRFKAKLPRRVGVDLRAFPPEQVARIADAAVCGMLLGHYHTGLYRTGQGGESKPVFGTKKSELILLPSPDSAKVDLAPAARRGEAFARSLWQIFDLVNAAGNRKNPEILTDWALRAGAEFGVQVRALKAAALKKEGLEALLAVGKGSPHPPTLVLLEYKGKGQKGKMPVIGLVGKGVTFDTGGVSLKPSANMHFMKSDMGGAAAVFGAFFVAAQLRLPVRLVGAVPVAENMIDGLAVKPGDVIGSYAGKTIEVLDTDAEGRLILADALAYLNRHEKPEVLIDLATLTGSIIRTLGYAAAGLFTQNTRLTEALCRIGEGCGERLWPMPMWDEYAVDLKSDVADLRNFTGKPMAEAISAAKFLEHFTGNHPAWAHLDIAGMAFGDTEFGQSKSATGFGVRLLVEFIEQWLARPAH